MKVFEFLLHFADSRTYVIRQTYVSRLLAHGCGTAFQLVLGKWTSDTNSLSGSWRLLHLGIEIAVHCYYLFKLCISKFSYLFTYIYVIQFCSVVHRQLVWMAANHIARLDL